MEFFDNWSEFSELVKQAISLPVIINLNLYFGKNAVPVLTSQPGASDFPKTIQGMKHEERDFYQFLRERNEDRHP